MRASAASRRAISTPKFGYAAAVVRLGIALSALGIARCRDRREHPEQLNGFNDPCLGPLVTRGGKHTPLDAAQNG